MRRPGGARHGVARALSASLIASTEDEHALTYGRSWANRYGDRVDEFEDEEAWHGIGAWRARAARARAARPRDFFPEPYNLGGEDGQGRGLLQFAVENGREVHEPERAGGEGAAGGGGRVSRRKRACV
eukprot:3166839-Rhodomonas_salina.2